MCRLVDKKFLVGSISAASDTSATSNTSDISATIEHNDVIMMDKIHIEPPKFSVLANMHGVTNAPAKKQVWQYCIVWMMKLWAFLANVLL